MPCTWREVLKKIKSKSGIYPDLSDLEFSLVVLWEVKLNDHKTDIKKPWDAERTREVEKWLQKGSSRRRINETKSYTCITFLIVFILKLFTYILCHYTEDVTPNLSQFNFTATYFIMWIKSLAVYLSFNGYVSYTILCRLHYTKISIDVSHLYKIGCKYLSL